MNEGKMKIILIQNTPYLPTKGGSDKSNKLLLESLAILGHECFIIAPATSLQTPGGFERFSTLVNEKNPDFVNANDDRIAFGINGVTIHALKKFSRLPEHLGRVFAEEKPDWIFVPSDDFAQVLLEQAVKLDALKVIYLARTTLTLPFGPDAYLELPKKAELVKKARGIMCVSRFISDYIYKWSGARSSVLPISLYGNGSFPDYGSFENGYVTMINPCAYKGISILLALAERFSAVRFLAVSSWGTSSEDIAAMKQRDNITVMDAVEDVELVYKKTKILLVPSLWAEAKARCIGEAMLRGIPVMASDVGGNGEAKCGTDYLLPVNQITKYEYRLDQRKLPVAAVPVQDVYPWRQALERLLIDREHYMNLSKASRSSAYDTLIKDNGVERVEAFLHGLMENVAGRASAAAKKEI
ncbi:MAG: glycosyltransferase [Spirochaetaceae bacterium]|nr:MAG: glycosyltransferase [Spirochaetaceae bacterium]